MTSTATIAGSSTHGMRGIALMLLSMIAFTAMDTVSKYLAIGFDGLQVA